MKLLVDENLAPRVVGLLAARVEHFATVIRNRAVKAQGMASSRSHTVLMRAGQAAAMTFIVFALLNDMHDAVGIGLASAAWMALVDAAERSVPNLTQAVTGARGRL